MCAYVCTFEEGGDVPHVDAASLHELSQSDLQEEDGNPPHQYDQHVWDQEHPWNTNRPTETQAYCDTGLLRHRPTETQAY